MSIPLSIALYLIIWWTLLFAVLPFGVKTQGESGEVVPGTPESAPTAPRLVRVALINTVVSMVVFVIVYLVITSGLFSFVDATTLPDGVQPRVR